MDEFLSRKRILTRLSALASLVFFAFAEVHEIVPLVSKWAVSGSETHRRIPTPQDPHGGHGCAFCVLLNSAAVVHSCEVCGGPSAQSPSELVPLTDSLRWSDCAWKPQSHRGPPSLLTA